MSHEKRVIPELLQPCSTLPRENPGGILPGIENPGGLEAWAFATDKRRWMKKSVWSKLSSTAKKLTTTKNSVKRRPDMSESGVNYYFRFSPEHFMIHTPRDNKLVLLPTKY